MTSLQQVTTIFNLEDSKMPSLYSLLFDSVDKAVLAFFQQPWYNLQL